MLGNGNWPGHGHACDAAAGSRGQVNRGAATNVRRAAGLYQHHREGVTVRFVKSAQGRYRPPAGWEKFSGKHPYFFAAQGMRLQMNVIRP